jgi:hypothetical protein
MQGLWQLIEPLNHHIGLPAKLIERSVGAVNPDHLKAERLGSNDIKGVGRDKDERFFRELQQAWC